MKQCYIYSRVSTVEQVSNLSLSTQTKACIEYADKEGWGILETFTEKGESAKTKDRTEFKRMLECCLKNKGKVQFVLVYSTSRFMRNTEEYLSVKSFLTNLGIQIISVTEKVDETPLGKFLETLNAGLAQLDNDQRAERTKAGMKEALSQGRFCHRAPHGYINASDPNGSKTILPDEKIAPFIKEAFELFSTGQYTQREVNDKLTVKGFKEKNGNLVSAQHFEKILKNPTYAGKIVEKKWALEGPGSYKPIISLEIFEKVQRLLNGNSPSFSPYLRNNPEFPVKGPFTKCGVCGQPLRGYNAKGRSKHYPTYDCSNPQCKNRASKADFENRFLAYIQTFRPTPESMNELSEKVVTIWKKKQASFIEASKNFEGQINALKMKKRKFTEAWVEGKLDKATYEEEMELISKELSNVQTKLDKYRVEDLDVKGLLDFTDYVLNHIDKLWLESPLPAKQRLQRVLFPEGVQYAENEFRTAETPIFFKMLEASRDEKSIMVALTPSNSNRLIAWFKEVKSVKESGALAIQTV